MSCDYIVWHSPTELDDEAATEIAMAIGDGDVSTIKAHPSLNTFYEELISIHPEIDHLTQRELEKSPWASTLERSSAYILINCRWHRAKYAFGVIKKLAHKHGLCMFDPQHDMLVRSGATARQHEAPILRDRKFWRFLDRFRNG